MPPCFFTIHHRVSRSCCVLSFRCATGGSTWKRRVKTRTAMTTPTGTMVKDVHPETGCESILNRVYASRLRSLSRESCVVTGLCWRYGVEVG